MRKAIAALAGIGLCGAVIIGAGPVAGAGESARVVETPSQAFTLNPAIAENPLDGASGRLHGVVTASGRTNVSLHITGLSATLAGVEFPTHVHVGPCTANLSGAGGHYNSGGPVDNDHESWLTFASNKAGKASSHDSDSFAIAPGAAKSIVVHRHSDGARLGCLPFEF